MAPTCSVALAGDVFVTVPSPPLDLRVLAGMVFIRFPNVVEVTSTATVQDPGVAAVCRGTVPPLRDSTVPPGEAVTLPPQLFETFGGFAMLIPGCTEVRLSIQLALVKSNAFGLNTFTSRRDVPPGAMESGVKLLFICAGNENPCA